LQKAKVFVFLGVFLSFIMIQYILTDIEGTTTSVQFVYETLFPYFKANFEDFVRHHYPNFGLAENIRAVQDTVQSEDGNDIGLDEAVSVLLKWVDIDRKHTALKNLQGVLWEQGYKNGEIKGHVYPDVPPKLKEWSSQNLKMGVYSSGSVQAQQLIFGYSELGDLRPYFSDYFDTNIGYKRESGSYQAIQSVLKVSEESILFLSDVEAELDAAKAVGFQTIQLVRNGTTPSLHHRKVSDFSEIVIE
jgi:enolase-phosphatase E1